MIRKAQRVIKIKARVCSLSNGVAPCAAVETCWNTRFTCRDLKNYDETTQDLWFVEPSETLPELPGLVFPVLQTVSTRATELNPGARFANVSALGKRAEITITVADFIHHDRGVDPYYADRDKQPAGTFWARWLARNPSYSGTVVELYTIVDGTLSLPEVYEIDSISTISAGAVQIVAKDVLRMGYDSTAPATSLGKITTDMTAVQTTVTIDAPDGYPASGVVLIGNELMDFTRAGAVLTLVRGQYKTTAETHSVNDLAQVCLVYDSQKTTDIIYDLLVNFGGVDPAYIDLPAWQADESRWMPATRLSRIIVKPEKIEKLISSICEQTLALIWFDQELQQIRFRPNQPGVTRRILTDSTHLLDSGVTVTRDDTPRVNVVRVYYDKRAPLDDDVAENYSRVQITVASDEVFRRYDQRIKYRDILASWLPADQSPQALILGAVVLQESISQLTSVSFGLEFKDSDLALADVVTLETRDLVDFSGYPASSAALIVARSEAETGLKYNYKAILSNYANIRYGMISPDVFDFDGDSIAGEYDGDAGGVDYDLNYLPPYSWPFYTALDRVNYVFLSDGNEPFPDNRLPYQLA